MPPLIDLGLDLDLGFGRPRRPRERKPTIEELLGDNESLLSSIGGRAMGGLEYLAGSLDKGFGGRAIRGVLGGRPEELLSIIPFSDTLGITDPQNAVSGRDLLGENTPGFDALDIPGFALEIALDPSTYLGLGAVGKGAKIASKAGLAGKVGGKTGFATRSLDDVLQALGPAERAAAERAAGGASELARVAGDTMGYGASIGLPFREPLKTFNSPTLAKLMDSGLDTLGGLPGADKLRTASRYVKAGMRPEYMGTLSEEFQPLAKDFYERSITNRELAKGRVAQELTELQSLGKTGGDTGESLRAIQEGRATPLPGTYEAGFAGRERSLMDDLLQQQQAKGVSIGELDDPAGLAFAHRQLSGPQKRAVAGDYRPLGTNVPGREDWTKGWRGGTDTLNTMMRDPDILAAADTQEAARIIAQKYGSDFVNPPIGTKPTTLDVFNEAAASIRAMPENIRQRAFGHHYLYDSQRYQISALNRMSAADTVADAVAQFGTDAMKLKAGERGVPLADIANKLGLNLGDANEGFVKNFMEKAGLDPTDANQFMAASQRVVPEHIAKDILKFGDRFQGPESVSGWLNSIDSLTNLFKAGVLNWPARFVRDHVSAQTLNFLTGNADIGAYTDAWHLLQGKEIADAASIPVVKDILTQRGLPLDGKHGTDILRELFYQHGIVGKSQGAWGAGNLSGAAEGMLRGSADDLFSELPGTNPYSMGMFKKQPGDTWNPLAQRGVAKNIIGGELREETTSYWGRVSQDVGALTEGMNRATPFLYNLRQGADPSYAKQVTEALQVNYRPEAYSAFEREWLLRLFPFYKWTSRMVPTILQELAQKPGGGVRQLIRGLANTSSDSEFVPEYLQGGLNIPLGGQNEDGSQSYLTQSGLAIEPLNLLQTGTRGMTKTGLNLLGMLNPLVKAPLEQLSGRQFYSDRDLRDLDPRTGRIMEQLGIVSDPRAVPQLLDQVIMNSPLSRAVSTAGQLADSRKNPLEKALNVLTGVRISDVDVEKQKQIAARELLNDRLRGMPGVGFFESAYLRDGADAELDPETARLFALLKAMQRQSQNQRRMQTGL